MRLGVAAAGAPVAWLDDAELDRRDARLLARLERDFEQVRARAGDRLACAAGCSDCCHGPFPITRLDARRLRRGLDALRARDAERAAAVMHRVERAVRTLTPGFPGDAATGRVDVAPERLDPFFESHARLACPVLDPASGRCDLYASRPVGCRTYGPPLRFGSRLADPCPLCFRDAPPEELERCRLAPDPEGLEQQLSHALGPVDPAWETLIAFALARRDDDGS